MKIIKNAIFGDNESYIFEENGFEIFDIDIKEIIPKDLEIAEKMNNAIKSNMEIYINKMKQNAKIEVEKTLIEGQKEIEKEKQDLFTLQHEHLRQEEMLRAEIKAEKIIKRPKAEAEAIKIKKEAEVTKIREIINAIDKNGASYLKLQQMLSLESIKKIVIVPTDSQMFLPIKDMLKELE